MLEFEKLLEISTKIHGHICAGQVIGVRMSMLALKLIEINDPKGSDRKKLYVIVEIDRCATDAIQSVAGCSLGKRSMKWYDHGIMAATFVNLQTKQAVRITAREESRKLSEKYHDQNADKYTRQLHAYKIMPEAELFKIENVKVDIPKQDLPGRPLKRIQCSKCGDWVQDCREIKLGGKVYCAGCKNGKYYQIME